MPNDPAPVDALVTQEDREAAAKMAEWMTDAQQVWEDMPIWFSSEAPKLFRKGGLDSHEFVQAFARHRLASDTTAERRGYQAATERAAGIAVAYPHSATKPIGESIARRIRGTNHVE